MEKPYDPDEHIKAGCELDKEDLHVSDCKLLEKCDKHPNSRTIQKMDGTVGCLRCHVESLPERIGGSLNWITLQDDSDDV